MDTKEAIIILSGKRDYYLRFTDEISDEFCKDIRSEATALDIGIKAIKMQNIIRSNVKEFAANALTGKYQYWSVGANGMACILNDMLINKEDIDALNHIGWKGVPAKFIRSNNDTETVWVCPNCKKEFSVKQMRPGLIQKRDLENTNYCSKCGIKFNWEDE